jgi:PAS domain S-box-containing protein
MSLFGVVLNRAGDVVFANDFALDRLGRTRDEFLGLEWFPTVLPPEIADTVRDVFLGAIALGDIPAHFENEVVARSGQRRLVAWSNTLLWDAAGRVDGVASIGDDVTDRRAVEEQLRQVVAGVDAIVGYRADGDAPWQLSPQLTAMLGYDPAEIPDFAAWDAIVHPDDLARCRAVWQADAAQQTWYLEYRVRHANGTWVWVDDRGRRTPAAPGRTPGLFGLIADATPRREAAERLRSNEARFQAVFEENPEAIGICAPVFDADGHFVDARLVSANHVTRERYLAGKHPEDLGAPFMFATWTSMAPLFDAAAKVAEQRQPVHVEHRAEVNGRDLWSALSLFPFEDGFAFIGRDVTNQKRAEADLRIANNRLRRVFDAGIIGMVVGRRDGIVLEANDYWLNLVHRTRAELERGEIDWRAMTAPDLLAADDAVVAALDESPTTPQEKQYVLADGTVVPALVIRTVHPAEPDLLSVLVLDMRHEVEAREDLARLATAISQTSESVVITDLDANILYVNPAFERVAGYVFDEVRGRNPRVLKSGIQPDAFYKDMWATLTKGTTWQGELVNRRRDGTLYVEEASISPIHDGAGAVTSYVAVKRDVTAERALEAQLRQSQRVEAIGQLAGGVAHDFNNYLAAIRGYGELVQAALAPGSPARSDMDEVMRAATRASDLTRQLLAFSRSQTLDPGILDPAAVIDALLPMLRSLIGEHIALVSVHEPGLGMVRADAGRLEQAIVNLAVNARDAMPQGGRLTIETRNVEPRGTEPAWVRITVTDTGSGMAPETLDHVFEPFFTTKGPGKGTGMGLATVHGIVQQSGGRITATSAPAMGAVFTIDLPRIEEPPTAAPATTPPPAASTEPATATAPEGSDKRVMLVEDDTAVRLLLTRLLTRLGHRVSGVGSGTEALERLDADGAESPDLLVTDVRMPGMQGPELARRMRARLPELPVLFVSAYASEIADEVLAMPHVRVLDKPFEAHAFAAAVRASLDEA